VQPVQHRADDFLERHPLAFERQLAGGEPGQVEQVADEAMQAIGLVEHRA